MPPSRVLNIYVTGSGPLPGISAEISLPGLLGMILEKEANMSVRGRSQSQRTFCTVHKLDFCPF